MGSSKTKESLNSCIYSLFFGGSIYKGTYKIEKLKTKRGKGKISKEVVR
jgi:hypothetical protein